MFDCRSGSWVSKDKDAGRGGSHKFDCVGHPDPADPAVLDPAVLPTTTTLAAAAADPSGVSGDQVRQEGLGLLGRVGAAVYATAC